MSDPLTILVVDGCRGTRRHLSALLDDAGHGVVTADSVRSALRALRGLTPDVVLTECVMRGALDGAALIRLLRRNPRFRETPVLVLSTETDPAVRTAMDAAGATGWIAKPLRVGTLSGALAAIGKARSTPVPSRSSRHDINQEERRYFI